MRRFAALQTCLGLLTAFALAPFQHVHTGDGDHDHAGLVHAHFYGGPIPQTGHGGRHFDDDDDHRAVWQVDAFTLVLTAGIAPFVPSRAPAILPIPSPTFEPVAVVEECGHDPPCADQIVPRAPPA
ncbi:MAG: hypothetical protein JO323_01550 [Acidobacteriia bacterium]|nr:hypothetical protein [Terriglobia bacterium]